ncbi:MAG: DUF134 domain-containing protein [Candidatus Omnitrophica bacterium]|nr:DUF134 domain-containing protein [Candidatus Omnitrophota bacterium]
MPRPRKERKICLDLKAFYFQPQGVADDVRQEVALEVDELEAVRLADLEGLYQADAARRMKVSRQTFGNTVARAHAKIAEALVKGKTIKINCPRLLARERAGSQRI